MAYEANISHFGGFAFSSSFSEREPYWRRVKLRLYEYFVKPATEEIYLVSHR